MRNVKTAVVCALAAAVCSCATLKEYSSPELSVVDSLFVAAGQNSIADLGWKDFFTDPALQALIDEGLANNTDLKTAVLRVQQAQSSLEMARKAFLPGVNIPLAGNMAFSEDRYSGLAESYSLPASASWELDFGGKLIASKRKAEAELQRSELAALSIRTELVASIAELYYGLLKLDAQLKVSETTAASWKENVRIMRAMKEAGMTNEASVSQTEANSCSVEASLYDLRYSITQMETALSVLMGVPTRHFERSTLQDISMPEITGTGVPASLLSRRPDVLVSENLVRQAFYDTQLAQAAFYPSVTINGQGSWEKAFTSPAGWLLNLGASVLQPVFAKGKLKGNLEIARSRQQESIENFRQTLLNSGKEVSDALALCESAEGKTDARIRQIKALESAVASTEMLMRHSGSTYLEVLTAQQSLLSARLQQISDRYDALRGSVALYKALGGGAR